jgi:hypothetical protein
MEAIVTMLRWNWHDAGPKLALWTLGAVFPQASSSLGLTFNQAGGPELLYEHLKSERHRNDALLAVFPLVHNAEHLGGVIDELAAHALCSDLANLCEQYPPVGDDAGERAEMQDQYQMVFGRTPDWVDPAIPDEVCLIR